MDKINCLIVDDEPIARQGIQGYCDKVPFLTVKAGAKNALEAGQILMEEAIDLLFLDIQMPELSGLDFLKTLSQAPMVIFTTAYREYALEGFELNVIDYLIKPIAFPRFLRAVHKVQEAIQSRKTQGLTNTPEEDFFFIKVDGKYTKIFFRDILYVEGLKDYVFIHTQTTRYMVLISLKNVEAQLPPEQFLRVHRSYIIALDKVEELDGNILKIKGKDVPLSKNLRDEIYEKLIQGRLWKRAN